MKRVDILEAALKRIANHVEDESLSGTDCRDIAKDALVDATRANEEEKQDARGEALFEDR